MPTAASVSARFASATTTVGRLCVSPYSTSRGTHQPFNPTLMAPSICVAQNATTHSGVFAARIATRSPFRTPWSSRSAVARAATAAACSV